MANRKSYGNCSKCNELSIISIDEFDNKPSEWALMKCIETLNHDAEKLQEFWLEIILLPQPYLHFY